MGQSVMVEDVHALRLLVRHGHAGYLGRQDLRCYDMHHVAAVVLGEALDGLGLPDARLAHEAEDDLLPTLVRRLDQLVYVVVGHLVYLLSIDRELRHDAFLLNELGRLIDPAL